ncbi:MAG: DUF1045 domain-containing protein [Pseudomonadota bacterium]
MSSFTRYAVYYLPPTGSALARFGADWLGWDNIACADRFVPSDRDLLTATPRKYGFHGTMKPPFRLADGETPEDLEAAVAALARRYTPFAAPALKLATLGRFIALVPSAQSEELAALAGGCVMDLDSFRAPPSEAELAKRRAADLTPAQEVNLMAWGYPYVMDQFRFHLTLTGQLDDAEIPPTQEMLADLTAHLCQAPMPVDDIALLGEVDGGHFHLIHRYALTG